MASRTYIPLLVHFLHKACVHIAKHRAVILSFLPEGSEPKLNAIVVACEAFMAIVPDNSGG